MRHPKTLIAAALALMMVLAGCATIPRDGAVQRGGSVQNQQNGFPQLDYIPYGPASGASRADILRGFIDAAVSPDGGYQIARQFLSSQFANEWNPDASVTVDREASRADPTTLSSTQLQLAVNPVAFVDASGDYTTADSHAPIPLQYTFVKEKGQWRISKAPDGIVIDSARFSDVFSSHALYFFSPDFRFLVPDERWFPSTQTSISTRIVKALLAGPSKWLADSVVTAFPNGTQLSNGSVPTQSGTAQVDLNSVAASADTASVSRMNQQLDESLSSTASVTTVMLTIDGVDRDGDAQSSAVRDPDVDANPVVLKDGVFGTLSGSEVTALPTIGKTVADLAPSAVTVSADRATAAVLAGGKVYAVRGKAAAAVVDSRAGLIAPSLDPEGDVWSVPGNNPNAFLAVAPDGTPVQLNVAWPDARSLIAFAVSRDGTRLAALVKTTDGQAHLMVVGIVRGVSGKVDHLGDPLDLGTVGLTTALSLSWVDELTVAVLGQSPQGGESITTQSVGGTSDSQLGPSDGAVIVGSSPAPQALVLGSDGALQTPRGNGWQPRATGISLVATQLGH